MHVGGICTNGIFCTVNSGNRDLADSISIVIDRGVFFDGTCKMDTGGSSGVPAKK